MLSAHPVLALTDAGDIDGRNYFPDSTIGGETTCIVCMAHPKSQIAVPCDHQSVCGICAERMHAPTGAHRFSSGCMRAWSDESSRASR